MSDQEFSDFAVDEIIKMGMIDSKDDVLDTHSESVKKAYPAYFDTYEEIDTLIHWLNGIDNLYCVGRNGQHRYNNIDHSMCTSFEAPTSGTSIQKKNITKRKTETETNNRMHALRAFYCHELHGEREPGAKRFSFAVSASC